MKFCVKVYVRSPRIRLKAAGGSYEPFDVVAYRTADRPTHPYKQGLLERNHNNLYSVRAYKRRLRVARYLPTAFHVCMHTVTCSHTVTWSDPIFAPRKGETTLVFPVKNQSSTNMTRIYQGESCARIISTSYLNVFENRWLICNYTWYGEQRRADA